MRVDFPVGVIQIDKARPADNAAVRILQQNARAGSLNLNVAVIAIDVLERHAVIRRVDDPRVDLDVLDVGRKRTESDDAPVGAHSRTARSVVGSLALPVAVHIKHAAVDGRVRRTQAEHIERRSVECCAVLEGDGRAGIEQDVD